MAHYARVKVLDVEANTDVDKAEWFAFKEAPSLALDHYKILRDAFSRFKQSPHFEPVGFELLPEVFTLPLLQNLHESILLVKFDRRNFANKSILTEVDDDMPRHGTRTPVKYRFDKDNYDRLEGNGFQLEV